MDVRLKNLIPWPQWEILQMTMPRSFHLLFSKNVANKIDWFEIFFWNDHQIYEPEQLFKLQTQVYIHCQCIASNSPRGCCFGSETWEGRVR